MREGQPPAIAAAVSGFRTQGLSLSGAPTVLPPDLEAGGLDLAASGRTDLAGLPVDAFVYRGRRGERVFLYLSRSPFPAARGAIAHTGQAHGWVAADGGVAMVCADEPLSYLLLGDDAARLRELEVPLREALPAGTALERTSRGTSEA
jgi:hypothetical protein